MLTEAPARSEYAAARKSAILVERNDRAFVRVHGRDPRAARRIQIRRPPAEHERLRHILLRARRIDHDLRADRAFTYRKSRLTLFLEVVNVTNHDNYRYNSPGFNSATRRVFGPVEELFPLLPVAGVLIEF